MSSTDEKDTPAGLGTEAPAPASANTDFRARARQAKLRMANVNLKEGKLNTATAMLVEIYQTYPNTAEGQEAALAINRLAEAHEAAGRHRLAADLYEKLAEE